MNKLIFGVIATVLTLSQAYAEGNAQAGKTKATTCAACHGADGNSITAEWPNLAGQSEQYLLKQMVDIKTGDRPVPTMAGLLDGFNEQDLADIAAFYSAQPVSIGAADAEKVALGARVYRAGNPETGVAACTACHSPTGQGNGPAGYPALSGQKSAYVAAQLRAFRNEERTNDGDARVMRDIAFRLNDKEIDAVSSYISGLH